jgi:hypothetical protein
MLIRQPDRTPTDEEAALVRTLVAGACSNPGPRNGWPAFMLGSSPTSPRTTQFNSSGLPNARTET